MSTNPTQLFEKLKTLPPTRLAEVEDFVDFLQLRGETRPVKAPRTPLDFPVDQAGVWPEDLSLRREDMYGDDGR